MTDYRKMTEKELDELDFYFAAHDMLNAGVELSDFRKVYNKTVRVFKGRKVPIGTKGIVFWVKRYDYSKYGDPWGIYSTTKVGIRTESGDAYFTAIDNVEIVD